VLTTQVEERLTRVDGETVEVSKNWGSMGFAPALGNEVSLRVKIRQPSGPPRKQINHVTFHLSGREAIRFGAKMVWRGVLALFAGPSRN
jgi:hypothetical protein